MIIEQLMPSLSPTMTEGTIVAWRIKPGDTVKSGQVMAEIQTDKAVVEWECLDAGTVAEILLPAGTAAKVNMIAAVFTTKGEDAADAIAKAKEKNAAFTGGAAPAKPAEPAPTVTTSPAVQHAATPVAMPSIMPRGGHKPASEGKNVRISPVASRLAAASGIDLRLVVGSGPDGRIIRRDIETAIKNGTAKLGAPGGSAAPAKAEKPKLKPFRGDKQPVVDVPVSVMRAAIGRRLLQSKQSIPHFQITEKIDASALTVLREQLNAYDGVKISVNDLVVRATALALRLHPKVNSTYDGTTIRQFDSADISIAVAIPDGLITPIVFKAHSLGVKQISDTVRDLAKRATEGKLKPAEFEGGTFTISNLGMYGIEQFNAIVNPPQAAILAVAAIKDEPVVKGGQIVPGKIMRVTLSADHRVIDGAAGAEFLKTLRELLESPAGLLI
jgi:pyruvate dehydrogenase E2 component (dihydrolipoamide acetyltransferase)